MTTMSHKKVSRTATVGLAAAALLTLAPARPSGRSHDEPAPRALLTSIPLAFERNDGQHAAAARYFARGAGLGVAMQDGSVALAIGHDADVSRLTLRFGNRRTPPSAERQLTARTNYFIGRDPGRWRAGIPTFDRVRYADVVDGIDLLFYGKDQQLEYDVVVQPGADPGAARISLDGADALRVEADGTLAIKMGQHELRHSRPVAYQEAGSERQPVAVRYHVTGRTISFDVGSYDSTRELVIDPVISFSSYLGGRTNDQIYDTVVDAAGNTYVTGQTDSTDFPVARPQQATLRGGSDVVVAKVSRDGALVYSTYFGGSGLEYGIGIDVDPTGAAYVVGSTRSADLPVTPGAFQSSVSGLDGDAFVFKLNAAGDRLAYSTYLGETAVGGGPTDIAVDISGFATAVGSTSSSTFPTTAGALDRDNPAGNVTGFASKLNATGTALVYSTFLTGNEQRAMGVALDSAGRAVIVGQVAGTMTTTRTAAGPVGSIDGFVLTLNSSGSAFMYSNRIGGSKFDQANAVVLDSADGAYVAGTTQSSDFPVGTFVFQDHLNGPSDAFVAFYRADGSIVTFYTQLFGGAGGESATGIGVAGTGIGLSGTVFTIFGETSSSDLPLKDAVQGTRRGGTDAFIAKLNFGRDVLFSTYLGGTRDEDPRAGELDGAGQMTIAGFTYSRDYPVFRAFQPANRSTLLDYPDGFITRASLLPRGTAGPRDASVHVAEGAVLHGAWERVADPSAAGSARIHNPDAGAAKLAQPLANPTDYFEFTVNGLFGGPYRVWVRGRADNNSFSNDSVYIQFSNAQNAQDEADIERPFYRIGTTEAMTVTVEDCSGCGLRGWGWQDSGYGRRVLGPPVFFNSGMPTTVRVQRREDGVSIDQIVFARDDGAAGPYFASAPGYQKDDDTIVNAQEPNVQGGTIDVVLYPGVDSVAVHGGWTVVSDPGAAGGSRVSHPDAGAAKLAAPVAAPAHFFDLHFQASPGVGYRLWIRGRAQNDYWGNDSVFVQFSDSVDANGAARWRLNTTSATTINLEDCSGCGLSAWGWQDNGYGADVIGPLVFFQDAGDHTIRIQTREDGLSIDQIVLSPVKYRDIAPGAKKNDTTIISR